MTDANVIKQKVAEITATVVAKSRAGRDPVNQPIINNWVEALGDRNPIYTDEAAARAAGHPGIVAPPAMIRRCGRCSAWPGNVRPTIPWAR